MQHNRQLGGTGWRMRRHPVRGGGGVRSRGHESVPSASAYMTAMRNAHPGASAYIEGVIRITHGARHTQLAVTEYVWE